MLSLIKPKQKENHKRIFTSTGGSQRKISNIFSSTNPADSRNLLTRHCSLSRPSHLLWHNTNTTTTNCQELFLRYAVFHVKFLQKIKLQIEIIVRGSFFVLALAVILHRSVKFFVYINNISTVSAIYPVRVYHN